MKGNENFDVIIIGGSYSGLAAGMALGRALTHVLIIDSGKACNRPTPFSHNFLTQDGQTPSHLATLARQQVQHYDTVTLFSGLVINAVKSADGFAVRVASGEVFQATKLIFATGIQDHLPAIDGLSACWGITVLHCPYCHGYEVSHKKTGVIGFGITGFELARLIANWTSDLTLFTNGKSMLSGEQIEKLEKHHVTIVSKEIDRLAHTDGHLHTIVFNDKSSLPLQALYIRPPFEQHCQLPDFLGCESTDEGYVKSDTFGQTTLKNIYACGDNTTRTRTIANAVAMGTATGMAISKQLISERF